ncbi:MAG: cytochrome c [Blastocatellales bacterium]
MSLRSNNITARRLLALFFVVAATWLAIHAQELRRNPEAQKLKNPEPSNAESIEAGKKLYQRFCASCHGPQGKGDGSLALAGGTPSDLTDDTWDFGSTDGEIFIAIRDGVSADMLAYKEKLNEKQIWQVVNYIRSIGPKPAKPVKPVKEDR